MRQLFPIFQTTAPEGTAQALPLYWDVDMDYDCLLYTSDAADE